MDTKQNQCVIGIQMETLIQMYPPSEIEESLFRIFETANVHSELDQDEREKRSQIHSTLRKIFRNCDAENSINCKTKSKCTIETK